MPKISDLFLDLEEKEIERFLIENKAEDLHLEKEEPVFLSEEVPNNLYILRKGSVVVESTDQNGNRSIVNIFNEEGTVFGEVYLYIRKNAYDYSAYANEKTIVTKIPKEAFLLNENTNELKKKILNNMLIILSQKAYYLNQKLSIVNSNSLRQKLAKYILKESVNDRLELNFNREELANYLGSTRPSVSRELMNMQKDGLIDVEGRVVKFNREKLKNFL